jgi:hypothetical protein
MMSGLGRVSANRAFGSYGPDQQVNNLPVDEGKHVGNHAQENDV